MSSLSESQFHTLYRGVNTDTPNLESAGMHWTKNKTAAKHFAVMETTEGYAGRGHVIEARVHNSNIIPVGTPEWHRASLAHGIMHPDDNTFEREVTVRPGSPVFVKGVHRVTAKNGRLRQFSNPTDTVGRA